MQTPIAVAVVVAVPNAPRRRARQPHVHFGEHVAARRNLFDDFNEVGAPVAPETPDIRAYKRIRII